MATIFYAVSGEGRGHAARARALVEDLKSDHDIVLYAPGHAFDLLAPVYRGSEIEVRKLPGLRFHYKASRQLGYFKTGYRSLGYVRDLPRLIRRLVREMEKGAPDLVITDFEPSLPRAAKRCGLPFISLDHQHFLLTYDLSSLPFSLRSWASFMAQSARAFYWGQAHSIVSSFYFPPLRQGVRNVTQIGVLMRPEIRRAQPHHGEHLVAYLRRFAGSNVHTALAGAGCPVHVYGLGARPAQGNLRFHDIDVHRFTEHLATCRGLVTTAGNQLVGEALYLGKPVLGMPEPGNREQAINAHFLERTGAGLVTQMDALDSSLVHTLIDDGPRMASLIDRRRLCGNPTALATINRYLSPQAMPTRLPVPA